MSGHPSLPQIKAKSSAITVSGSVYTIHLSYHEVSQVSGYVVGIKFADRNNSMNPANRGSVNGAQLGIAIGQRIMQMVESDLDSIALLGFYLLTDGLDQRGDKAIRAKKRIYSSTAVKIHTQVKHRLPLLKMLEVSGGVGWAMSRQDFNQSREFDALVQQLGKQLEISDVSSPAR